MTNSDQKPTNGSTESSTKWLEDAARKALMEAAEAAKKSSGVTSYRWNPPKWTEEELRRSTEAHSRFLNASARRTGLPAAWVRACGGIPDPDLK